MEPKGLLKQALEFFFRTSFKRVLSTMIVLGVTLLGLSWPDVAEFVLEEMGQKEQSGAFVTFAQLAGVGMIGIGFVGHLLLYVDEKRAERRAVAAQQQAAAAQLVGRVRVLVAGFRDSSVKRDAGYYNHEIAMCQEAAVAFRDVAPPSFVADRVVSAISNPKIDASKQRPYFDIELSDLESLVEKMEKHYEIK